MHKLPTLLATNLLSTERRQKQNLVTLVPAWHHRVVSALLCISRATQVLSFFLCSWERRRPASPRSREYQAGRSRFLGRQWPS